MSEIYEKLGMNRCRKEILFLAELVLLMCNLSYLSYRTLNRNYPREYIRICIPCAQIPLDVYKPIRQIYIALGENIRDCWMFHYPAYQVRVRSLRRISLLKSSRSGFLFISKDQVTYQGEEYAPTIRDCLKRGGLLGQLKLYREGYIL